MTERALGLTVEGIVIRNTLVTYDREHEKIVFWKTNCSVLWERLHISTAPPPVTASDEVTVDRAHAPGPSGPPLNEDPEEMSSYENVVGGKLKLKGKALDVKTGGVKKKKKQKKQYEQIPEAVEVGILELPCEQLGVDERSSQRFLADEKNYDGVVYSI